MARRTKKTETKSHPLEHMLKILSYHIRTLYTDKPTGAEKTCAIGYTRPDGTMRSVVYTLKIEPAQSMFASVTALGDDVSENHRGPGLVNVWDTVTINGQCYGNRCGGCDELARMMAPLIAECAKEENATPFSDPMATIETYDPREEKQLAAE